VETYAEGAEPLTILRAVGWSLPPSPPSISIRKGSPAILYPTPVGIPLGIAASAILYPTPISIPLGITASAILSTGDYRTGDYRTGGYRHRSRVRGKTPTCRSGSLTIGSNNYLRSEQGWTH